MDPVKKILFAFLLSLFGLYLFQTYREQADLTVGKILTDQNLYTKEIQPIFDTKCVACHSCYNSPCQLNLSSFEGVDRGMSRTNIYDFPLLNKNEPTRLFIDAKSAEEWRTKGFHPVTGTSHSILGYLVSEIPGVESGKQLSFPAEDSRTCITTLDDIDKYLEANPAGRMPFGLPKLSENELGQLEKWLEEGAPGPRTIDSEAAIINHTDLKSKLTKWEDLLNRKDFQSQISSRYLYEHLFLANIYLDSHPNLFFRLVRSATQAGSIDELPTDMPFDLPKISRYFYRLRPVINTIVHKSHIPFEFSELKYRTWKEDLFDVPWPRPVKSLPAFGVQAANPFKTFESIPVKFRYQLFIDDALYFVMTFIKGPVCRGQTALNVINDHFWILFLKPNNDVLVNSKETYDQISSLMEFPIQSTEIFAPIQKYRQNYWKALELKFQTLKNQGQILDPSWIDPDKKLTVYRHFDSASVMRDLRGEVPKTIWVLDYHTFESIYYNLAAGYNVFGPVAHQISSRLYMDISRMAAEDLFISFTGQESRANLRLEWTTPTPIIKKSLTGKIGSILNQKIAEELSGSLLYPGTEIKSKALSKDEILSAFSRREESLPSKLRELSQIRHEGLQFLPETMFVRVGNEAFSVLLNREHFNVSTIFYEELRRNPKKDSIDVLQGIASSYVNAFVILKGDELDHFVDEFKNARTQQQVEAWLRKYAVKRSDPKIWDYYMWFSAESFEPSNNEKGLLDLNRLLDY